MIHRDPQLNDVELSYLDINPHHNADFLVNQVLIEWMRNSNKRGDYCSFVFDIDNTRERKEKMVSFFDD